MGDLGQVDARSKRDRRGGWQGSPNSLRTLRSGFRSPVCRVCEAKGKWQPAVKGTDLCKHHGGLLVAHNKGTRRKDTDPARVADRAVGRIAKRLDPPPELAGHPIWCALSRRARSGQMRLDLLGGWQRMVENGDPELWIKALASAKARLGLG